MDLLSCCHPAFLAAATLYLVSIKDNLLDLGILRKGLTEGSVKNNCFRIDPVRQDSLLCYDTGSEKVDNAKAFLKSSSPYSDQAPSVF